MNVKHNTSNIKYLIVEGPMLFLFIVKKIFRRTLFEPKIEKRRISVTGHLGLIGIGLLLMNGCVSAPQFIFGSKPPVSAGERQDKPAPAIEPTVAKEDKSSLKVAASPITPGPDNVNQTTSDNSSVGGVGGEKAITSPAPLADVLSGEAASCDNDTGRPKEVERVDTAFIAGRLALYRKKLTTWNQLAGSLVSLDMGGTWPKGWYGCVQRLEMVFAGYRRLRTDSAIADAPPEALAAYQRDVEYLESTCDEVMASGQADIKAALGDFNAILVDQAASSVRQYLEQGKNLEAGLAYEHFVQIYGNAAATSELKILYSEALRRQGRMEASLVPLRNIWADNDNWGITYADLLLADGKPAAARKIYEEIGNKLAATRDNELWVNNQLTILDKDTGSKLFGVYTEVLRAYYRFNGQDVSAGFAANLAKIKAVGTAAMSDNSGIITKKVDSEIDRRTDMQLAKIDELIGGQEFEQAHVIVNELLTFVSADRRSEVMAAQDRIEETRKAARLGRQELDKQKNDRQWQAAVDLLDRREYRAAIGIFRQLLKSDYGDEANVKIAEAANMDAVEVRRKAAGLFFKARKTDNPQLKRQLLLQSRDLLRQVAEEYPEAEIIVKIKRNIQVLDDQLGVIPSVPEK